MDEFITIPLTSSDDEEEEIKEIVLSPRGLCVDQAIKTSGFMNMFYEAYCSEDPHGKLRKQLKFWPQIKFNWGRIQDLLSMVRWNVTETKDDSHPMAFVVQDLEKLRARQPDENKEEELEVIMWTFCFYATSIPQVWCDVIVPPRREGEMSMVRLNPDMRPCAYSAPNKPVPWVWFNANGHASINMIAHNMIKYKKRVLRVALYRKFKAGVINTIKPEFTFDKKTDAMHHNMSLLHLIVDTTPYEKDEGGITVQVYKPVQDWTFMIFLSEGAEFTFVSATLNDGERPEGKRLLKYPVVIHELYKAPLSDEQDESR